MSRERPTLRTWAIRSAGRDGLLEHDEIVGAATQWQNLCGVYFLIAGGRVVYVGQSISVYARIAQHAREKEPFDAVAVISCDRADLDVVESLYIHRLRPAWNGRQGAQMVAPMRERELWK